MVGGREGGERENEGIGGGGGQRNIKYYYY